MAFPERIRRRTRPATIEAGLDQGSRLRLLPSSSPGAPPGAHLFDHWTEVAGRVRDAAEIRLFLDFDGTLVAYRPSPEQVRLAPAARAALRDLVRCDRVRLAIVSGRRRAVLTRFVKVPRVELLGLYGSETLPGGMPLAPPALRKLARARVLLARLPRQLPGIFIEDKGVSLAVHFRGAAPQTQRRARAFLRAIAPRLRPEMHLIRSHSAWEVVPRQVRGKGAAVRDFLREVPEPYLPIYVGDDKTDEPALALLRRGITVHVGPGPSKARFRLNGTGEVCAFLRRLKAELS